MNEKSESTFYIEMKPFRRYRWKPKKDITTYELSLCLPAVTMMQSMNGGLHNHELIVDGLPENCRRHFKFIDDESITE